MGNQCRLYTRVVDEIPRGTTEYHVVFVFFIDPAHEYPHAALAEFSRSAETKAERVTDLPTVSEVDDFLAAHDALDEDDLQDLLP